MPHRVQEACQVFGTLRDEVVRAGFHGLRDELLAPVCGEEDGGRADATFPDAPQEGDAVVRPETVVDQHQVIGVPVQARQGLFARCGVLQARRMVLERLVQALPDENDIGLAVVDEGTQAFEPA